MIRQQRGFVSLISVTMISIVISIITISLVSLMTNEVHQATDASDRVQAQYAAESGAQDALAYIKAHPGADPQTLNQYCNVADQVKVIKPAAQPSGIDPAITCREIIANGTASGTLQKDQSVQIDLSDTTKLDNGSLEIDWDINRANGGTGARTFSSPNFSNPSSWQSPLNGKLVPPAMELTVASDSPSNAPAGSTQTQSIYLLPQCVSFVDLSTDGACDQINNGSIPAPSSIHFGSVFSGNQAAVICSSGGSCAPTQVRCFAATGTSDYDCKVYVPGWQAAMSNLNLPEVTGSTQYILRLKALYADGDYQMILRDCADPSVSVTGCNPVPLALSNAQIDVTAQVGGAYQRVTDQAPVRTNPLGSTSFALLGENNLCKTFDLFDEGGGNYVPQGQPACSLTDPLPAPF